MNTLARIALIASLAAATPAFGHGTPTCDAIEDGVGINAGIDTNLEFYGDDLVFRDNGETLMRITEDRKLYLHGERVELDERGRELVDRYYETVERFTYDAMDLAGDAAGLGVSAAIEAIAAVFHGEAEMQAMEARVEARAREIEAKANDMCERFTALADVEREMQEVVPGFEPLLFASDRQ